MDFLSPFALIGLLLLVALPFLLLGDRLFWFLAFLIAFICVLLLAFFFLGNRSVNGALRSVVAAAVLVFIAALVIALVKRRYAWATLLMGPLVAGALLVLHGVMLVTGGIPIMLLIAFMGGGIEFWMSSGLALFLLGALPVLALAWKSGRWARIVVSSLFGVLIMATALAPIFGFVDRSRPGSPFAYLAALAAGVVAAALGMWFQYRQQRRHPNASADEPAQA